MSDDSAIAVRREGTIAIVTLARPEARNRLSKAMLDRLVEVFGRLRDDEELRVVVLDAAGTDFSAGVDLRDPELTALASAPIPERKRALQSGPRVVAAIQALPQITICAAQGYCLGGAVCLLLACDLRVAAGDLRLGTPEILRGMNMSWRSVPLLVAQIGPARAKELLLTGGMIDAGTAQAWGLVNRVVEGTAEDARLAARNWAEELVGTVPPAAAWMIKDTVNAIANAHTPMVHMDTDQFILSQMTEDFQEAVRAFLEKREPKFRGR